VGGGWNRLRIMYSGGIWYKQLLFFFLCYQNMFVKYSDNMVWIHKRQIPGGLDKYVWISTSISFFCRLWHTVTHNIRFSLRNQQVYHVLNQNHSSHLPWRRPGFQAQVRSCQGEFLVEKNGTGRFSTSTSASPANFYSTNCSILVNPIIDAIHSRYWERH
jgi:hypothetical protein